MASTLESTERQRLAREVAQVRSGMLFAAWSATALNEGFDLPDTESRRFELYEGLGFVLDLLAARLA